MEDGDYVRVINTLNEYVEITKIKRILEHPFNYKTFLDVRDNEYDCDEIIKSSPNIIDLIETMDLMFIDICPDDCGGIVVPRIAETPAELKIYKEHFKDGSYILKGIITKEQLESMEYRIGG